MSPEKKWDFQIPEHPPSIFQRVKMDMVRATNNFQKGFDGLLTPIQMGTLESPRPLRNHEVIMARLLHDKDIMKMISTTIKTNGNLNRTADKTRRLQDLDEDTRTIDAEIDADGAGRQHRTR